MLTLRCVLARHGGRAFEEESRNFSDSRADGVRVYGSTALHIVVPTVTS